jgi:hypothetical protein
MEAGWSSAAIEAYAQWRFHEDVPASTVRTYRKKHSHESKEPTWVGVDPEATIDVMGERAMLIQLQKQRIAIDAKHETDMSKLFGSTRAEIQALSSLLDAHKGDLQDLGLFPKAGETLTVREGLPAQEMVPRSRTLGEALGLEGVDEPALAKVLHLATGTNGDSGDA